MINNIEIGENVELTKEKYKRGCVFELGKSKIAAEFWHPIHQSRIERFQSALVVSDWLVRKSTWFYLNEPPTSIVVF